MPDVPDESAYIVLVSTTRVPLPDAQMEQTWEQTVPMAQSPSDTIATRGLAPTRRLSREHTGTHGLTLGPELGRGGFGTVNLATQEVFGRRVAVKRLLSARDGDAGRRFYAEAVVTASLEHPNVVPIHDLVVDSDQRLSLVMKCIEGVTWSALLKADPRGNVSAPAPSSPVAPRELPSALDSNPALCREEPQQAAPPTNAPPGLPPGRQGAGQEGPQAARADAAASSPQSPTITVGPSPSDHLPPPAPAPVPPTIATVNASDAPTLVAALTPTTATVTASASPGLGNTPPTSPVPSYNPSAAPPSVPYGSAAASPLSAQAHASTATAPRPRPLDDHLDILLKVCDAVAFAHERGILHRDLKPANVMVGAFGEVQVMDWGCAVAFGPMPNHPAIPRVEDIDQVAGTPSYMAPELAMATTAAIGPHSDVYLLGAILYEIITGTPPHQGSTVHAVLIRAGFGDIDSPEHRAPDRDIPAELSTLALRALARNVADRIPTVTAFAQGIRDYRAHAQAAKLGAIARDYLNQATVEAGKNPQHADELLRKTLAAADNALDLWPGHRDTLLVQATAMRAAADHALATGAYAAAANHARRAADAWRKLKDTAAANAADAVAAKANAGADAATRRHLLLGRLRAALIAAVVLILCGAAAGGLVIYEQQRATVDALERVNAEQKATADAEAAARKSAIAQEKAEQSRKEEQARLEAQETKARAEHAREWQPVVSDDFSDPARSKATWHVELGSGKVVDGVFKTGSIGCVLSLTQPLSGDVRIEWDTRFDADKLDSVQCFFAANDMPHPAAGQLRNMQSGYIFAAGGYDNTVDFVSRIAKPIFKKPDQPLIAGTWFHAVATRIGAHLTMTLNGQTLFDIVDPDPLPGGGVGVGLASWGATSWRNVHIARLGTAQAMDPIELADYFLWMEQAGTARDIFAAVKSSSTDPARRTLAEQGFVKAATLADRQRLVADSIKTIRGTWPTATVVELNGPDGMDTLEVDLAGLKIKADIGILANAPIQSLEISGTDLDDLTALKTLPLTALRARHDHLRSLAPLAGMKLFELTITGNDITDLSPIAGMPIVALIAEDNHITTIDPIATCPRLNRINLNRNPVTSLFLAGNPKIPVMHAMSVVALDIGSTGITDLAGLQGQPLSILLANHDHLTDLAPLAGMQLNQLSVADNDLTDLAPLAGMPVEHLSCADNHLTSLDPLDTCAHLVHLECGRNRITDLEPLAGLDKLRRLVASDNQIASLEPLRHCRLTLLECSGNPITSLDPIHDSALDIIGAINTRITSLDALANQTTMKDADVSGAPITDLGPWLANPPDHALFNCSGIPDVQLQQAADAWQKTAPKAAAEARMLLLIRHRDLAGLRALATALDGHHYLLIPLELTWAAADRQCRDLGGHLVTIGTDAEYDLVQSMGRPYYVGTGFYGRAPSWIGLHVVDGARHWIDDTPANAYTIDDGAPGIGEGFAVPVLIPTTTTAGANAPPQRDLERALKDIFTYPCVIEWDD